MVGYLARTQKLFPDTLRHQGGPLPRFHEGGSPAFEMPPLHNEIDARLLRNEMVLIEAQQAQLFNCLENTTIIESNAQDKIVISVKNYWRVQIND